MALGNDDPFFASGVVEYNNYIYVAMADADYSTIANVYMAKLKSDGTEVEEVWFYDEFRRLDDCQELDG